MQRAQEEHKARFSRLARQARILFPDCLPLTAGSCTVCCSCTYPDRPCRFPGKMLSSMEAYGMVVVDICKANGMGYYYGPQSMAYTSCFLLE
mgnify:CR=1 FL=1